MTFQSTVRKQYTLGFPGEIVRDGPTRGKMGRIISATLGTDPGASTNRISRAFGFTNDNAETGATDAAMSANVTVGGAVFYGILGRPKHFASSGSAAGSLAPTLDLPQYTEGAFFDMATGFVAELINETTGTKATAFGDQVAYISSAITTGQNPQALPYGALISVPAGSSAPAGTVLIPNARVINPISAAASAVGALVSAYTVIQLTQ